MRLPDDYENFCAYIEALSIPSAPFRSGFEFYLSEKARIFCVNYFLEKLATGRTVEERRDFSDLHEKHALAKRSDPDLPDLPAQGIRHVIHPIILFPQYRFDTKQQKNSFYKALSKQIAQLRKLFAPLADELLDTFDIGDNARGLFGKIASIGDLAATFDILAVPQYADRWRAKVQGKVIAAEIANPDKPFKKGKDKIF